MIVLLRNEATRHSVSLTTELAPDHPQANGDRVQLQQVLMNLMINAVDALKDVDATRDLVITSQRAKDMDYGTGMGLRISHSIIESRRPFVGCRPSSARCRFLFHITDRYRGA
jgi:C4-dicarboxylate-specific signal transduction histidine kinase